MRTLILGCSSGTLSYRVVEPGLGTPALAGTIRRIGPDAEHVYRYAAGRGEGCAEAGTVEQAVERLADLLDDLQAAKAPVGADVAAYVLGRAPAWLGAAAIVDDACLARLEASEGSEALDDDLLRLVRAGRGCRPRLPHVAVADDTFFRTLPAESSAYLLPESIAVPLGLRRRGRRGLLHDGALARTAPLLEQVDAAVRSKGQAAHPRRVVMCYLEGSAGVTAVLGNRPIWTTFGCFEGDGLPGETCAGSVDVGVLDACLGRGGMSVEPFLNLLRTGAGLGPRAGGTGVERVAVEAEHGIEPSRTAWGAFVQNVAVAVGGAVALLGGIDALVFIGAGALHSARFRHALCSRLSAFGVRAVEAAPVAATAEVARLSPEGAMPLVLAVPAHEDEMVAGIARELAMERERREAGRQP